MLKHLENVFIYLLMLIIVLEKSSDKLYLFQLRRQPNFSSLKSQYLMKEKKNYAVLTINPLTTDCFLIF